MKESVTLQKLTMEERRLCRFAGPGKYPTRLQQYLKCPEVFAEATKIGLIALSLTATFRHYLRRFIRKFRPEKLLPDKDLWLCIARDGRFLVRQGKNGEEIVNLSETDHYIFHYLCFLQLHQFWNGIRKHSRFPATRLLIAVRDFSDRMDESVDYDALLRRAECIAEHIRVIK